MNSPLVSIITPCYNSEKHLSETILSVINQTYIHWEHIIVDDGSNDKTLSIIKKYSEEDKRIKIYHRGNRLPKGRSTSRNIGIEKAIGKYIIFLDSDDILKPFCLQKRVELFEQNREMDFLVFQMEMLTPDGKIKNIYSTIETNNYLNSFLESTHPWNVTCPIWKRSFLINNNLHFDEELSNLEDPLLHIEALLVTNAQYKIYSDSIYSDSQYRVDYKPSDLGVQVKSATLFFKKVTPLIENNVNAEELFLRLGIYYTTFITHCTGQNIDKIYAGIDDIASFNNNYINLRKKHPKLKKATSTILIYKTKLVLYLIKYRYFENRVVVKMLAVLGFKNFYTLIFKNFIK